MKILALAVLLTVVQTSPPVPRQTSDSAASAGKSVQSNTTRNKAPAADPSALVNTHAPNNDRDAAKAQTQDDTQHAVRITELPPVTVNPAARDWMDRGTWVFNLLLAFTSALQVLLLLFTLGAIRRQADLMERQINKERARIRIDLKHLELQQPDPGEGETVQVINYVVTFYGFTYAFVDEDAFGAWLSDSADAEERGFGRIGSGPSQVIVPGTAPDGRLQTVDTTKFEVDSLLHGKSFIHFKGRIKYRDFAEIERETTIYCVWQSFGPRKGHPPSILGGSGRWEKNGPPEANHET